MSYAFDLVNVHESLAAQLANNIARPSHVYAFDPGPEARQYPAIVVNPGDPYVSFHETFGDNALNEINLAVTVMIVAAEIDQRIALAAYCSNGSESMSSVRRAVEIDTSVGGSVANIVCRSCGPPEEIEPGVLAAVFDVSARAHIGG